MIYSDGTWSHNDAFPVIARVIREIHTSTNSFVRHDEIVDRLLSDHEGCALIDAAHRDPENTVTRREIAANMAAWFSQKFTMGTSKWIAYFERKRIRRRWAYKPINRNAV